VLLLERIEYANLYHAVTEWFNAYVVLRATSLLETSAWTLEIFDAHPPGALDEPWHRLFRGRRFSERVSPDERPCYARLLLGAPGYLTRFSYYAGRTETRADCQLLGDFRRWLLLQYGLASVPSTTTTTTTTWPRVTLVVRRPYVAHPRNPSGRVSRRWTNETQLLAHVTLHVAARVQAVDWAEHTFAEQLAIVAATDVLVGVHGAGLSHVVFMTQPMATLIEVAWGQQCFANLATMAGVSYEQVPARERGDFVAVDHDVVVRAITRALAHVHAHAHARVLGEM
jgi:glycoprotein 2-beta-D-xylosyltransferase